MKYFVSVLALALAASAISLDEMQTPAQPIEDVLTMGVTLANFQMGYSGNTRVMLGVVTPVQDTRPMTHISCLMDRGNSTEYACKASLKTTGEIVGTCVGTGTPSALKDVHNGNDLNLLCPSVPA